MKSTIRNVFLMLAASLPLTSAYQLTACTDTACSENCVVINGDDVDGTGPCNDLGFVAMSVEWYDTTNTLDGWAADRGGCLDGPGNEDAWISSGNPAGYCIGLENSEQDTEGFQYYLVNSSGE
jgi:hypothetical protein